MKGSTKACHKAIHFGYYEYNDLQKAIRRLWQIAPGRFISHQLGVFCWSL